MKALILKVETIEDFILKHPATETSFNDWLDLVNSSENWTMPQDIIKSVGSADILGSYKGENSKRIVFNIAGNAYRMICYYQFGKRYVRLYIKWIGTHADYTKLCAANKQYTVNDY